MTGNMGKRPGIVLTKLEEESRSSKGLYTTSFDSKQPELSKLAALEWRETRRNPRPTVDAVGISTVFCKRRENNKAPKS